MVQIELIRKMLSNKRARQEVIQIDISFYPLNSIFDALISGGVCPFTLK